MKIQRQVKLMSVNEPVFETLIGESNTVVSAYTMYRPLQQYCSHPLTYGHQLQMT